MSLPALRALRSRFPEAHIAVLAKPWVAALYEKERAISRVIPLEGTTGFHDWRLKLQLASSLRRERFDLAVLFPNSFESAALIWLGRATRSVGYATDGRGWLLTDPVPRPKKGQTPRHERFYYLELLREQA